MRVRPKQFVSAPVAAGQPILSFFWMVGILWQISLGLYIGEPQSAPDLDALLTVPGVLSQ